MAKIFEFLISLINIIFNWNILEMIFDWKKKIIMSKNSIYSLNYRLYIFSKVIWMYLLLYQYFKWIFRESFVRNYMICKLSLVGIFHFYHKNFPILIFEANEKRNEFYDRSRNENFAKMPINVTHKLNIAVQIFTIPRFFFPWTIRTKQKFKPVLKVN